MRRFPIGCVIGLIIVGIIVFGTGKELLKTWRERQAHQRTTLEIRRFIQEHRAYPNLQGAYEQCLPKGKTFLDALSVEKQQAVAKLMALITNRPVLFLGRIKDVREVEGHYTLISDHVDIFSPFIGSFVCTSNHAERVAAERVNFMDTFAIIVEINRVEEKTPTEDSSIRFLLHGTCKDVLYCGSYWPSEKDLPNQ